MNGIDPMLRLQDLLDRPRFPLHWPLICLAFVFALGLGGFGAWQYGIRSLKTLIEQTLGSQGEAREIRVGLAGIEILDLRIRAREGGSWPGEDELRARRIRVAPDIFSLLSARPSIDKLLIEGANVVLLRTKAGKIKVVPSLFDEPSGPPPAMVEATVETKSAEKAEKKDKKDAAGEAPFDIGQIVVSDSAIEFYDESTRATPVKLRIEQIEATIGKLRLPELAGPTSLKIEGVVKGSRQDGKLSIGGSLDIAAKESKLLTQLRDVDMTLLQAYLIKAAKTGVRRGTLDLDLDLSITGNKLRAPGMLTLSGLELAAGPKTFMGLPRSAAIGLLNDKRGRISMEFVLEGDINDPRFSFSEHLATRLASSLAGELGVNLDALTRDVGRVESGSVKAIGKSIKRALGKRRGGKHR
jgi:hypothetical protein